MKILFFSQARGFAGCSEWVLKTDRALGVEEFWAEIVALFPDLAPLQRSARLARNETYLLQGEKIEPEDEVAIIPPVSGG